MKFVLIGSLMVLMSVTGMAADSNTTQQLEANKAIAVGWLDTMYNKHRVREAYEKYASPRFHHHAQWAAATPPEQIVAHNIESGEKMVKQYPKQRLEIKHVVAEGNMVIVHSRYIDGPGVGEEVINPKKGNQKGPKTGEQVVDIVRIENGKIAEHWEVSQHTTDLADVF